MNPYAAPIDTTKPEARPACDGDWHPFWELIDRPNNALLANHLADRYCGTCPLGDTCLMVTRDGDENWAPAAYTIRQQLAIINRKQAADAA
jgi:hypothetical protein